MNACVCVRPKTAEGSLGVHVIYPFDQSCSADWGRVAMAKPKNWVHVGAEGRLQCSADQEAHCCHGQLISRLPLLSTADRYTGCRPKGCVIGLCCPQPCRETVELDHILGLIGLSGSSDVSISAPGSSTR